MKRLMTKVHNWFESLDFFTFLAIMMLISMAGAAVGTIVVQLLIRSFT